MINNNENQGIARALRWLKVEIALLSVGTAGFLWCFFRADTNSTILVASVTIAVSATITLIKVVIFSKMPIKANDKLSGGAKTPDERNP